MEPAYVSALAALAGSLVGGLTSVTGSWLSQFGQLRVQQHTHDRTTREELYRSFIEEASRLYADAFEHNEPRVANLIGLYSLISRMRVRSSPTIVATAEKVVHAIVETYLAPNKSFVDVKEFIDGDIDPLRDFSNACRDEWHAHEAGAPFGARNGPGRPP